MTLFFLFEGFLRKHKIINIRVENCFNQKIVFGGRVTLHFIVKEKMLGKKFDRDGIEIKNKHFD